MELALEDDEHQKPLPTFTLCRGNNAKYTVTFVDDENSKGGNSSSGQRLAFLYNNTKELPDFLSGAVIFGEFRGEVKGKQERCILA